MIELKDIEERVVKIVELNPSAQYVVLLDEWAVSAAQAEEIAAALNRVAHCLVLVVDCQASPNPIRVLEIHKEKNAAAISRG